MSTGEVNSNLTGEETRILDGNELEDVNSAASGLLVPNTSEEVARQIRAATDPLTKQLEKLCDVVKELRRGTTRRNEGTSAPTQGPSGPRGERYDRGVLVSIFGHHNFNNLKQALEPLEDAENSPDHPQPKIPTDIAQKRSDPVERTFFDPLEVQGFEADFETARIVPQFFLQINRGQFVLIDGLVEVLLGPLGPAWTGVSSWRMSCGEWKHLLAKEHWNGYVKTLVVHACGQPQKDGWILVTSVNLLFAFAVSLLISFVIRMGNFAHAFRCHAVPVVTFSTATSWSHCVLHAQLQGDVSWIHGPLSCEVVKLKKLRPLFGTVAIFASKLFGLCFVSPPKK